MEKTKQPLIHFLNSTGVITSSQAEEIANGFTHKTIEKHQFLLQAGKISNEYFFLSRGFMRAFVYDTLGNDVTTGFYANGQVVLEVSSFFNRTSSQEYLQALTDCEGWCLTYHELNALFHARAEFREFGRSVLVRGYAALKDRMLSAITETAAARYEGLLQANPEIVQHAPLKNVASYLGITDTSLSRIRKGSLKK